MKMGSFTTLKNHDFGEFQKIISRPHHEGYRCISSSSRDIGPTSWGIFMFFSHYAILGSGKDIYFLKHEFWLKMWIGEKNEKK